MFLMAPPFVFLMYMIPRQPRLFFLEKGLILKFNRLTLSILKRLILWVICYA